jgi:hypothetical protein
MPAFAGRTVLRTNHAGALTHGEMRAE